MNKNGSTNKILIVLVCSFIVVVTILIVVIKSINATNENKVIENKTISDQKNKDTLTDQTEPVVINEQNQEIADTLTLLPTPTESSDEMVNVTLGEYKGIKVDYNPVKITDEDIEDKLDELKGEFTEIIDMPDRTFEKGDIAIVSYRGMIGDNQIDELMSLSMQVVLGNGILPDIFEDKIIGSKVGDTFTVDIDYPDDYTDIPSVAGKTVVFYVELVDGFVFDIPEINDDFIKKATEYSSVEEYKTSTMDLLQKEQDDIAFEEALKEIKVRVIENCSYSGPINDEIKKQYVILLNTKNSEFQDQYMMDAATYYEVVYNIPPSQYSASLMEEATIEVKYNYALDEIIKAEGIDKANPDADRIKLRELAEQFVIDSANIDGLDK